MKKRPTLTKRKFKTTPALDITLDEIFRALAWLMDQKATAAGLDQVLNDSQILVQAGFLYGRNASGLVALASAADGHSGPMWLAEGTAGGGQHFIGRTIGPSRVYVADRTATFTRGALAWLAGNGTVTPTLPASGRRFMCGRFNEASVDSGGRIGIDLFLFPQSGGAL